MGYQSETQLEEQLIRKLGALGYEFVKIKDYDELVTNFRKELNIFNKEALENREVSDTEFNRIIIELTGKTVYQCAKILRDKIVLDRHDGSEYPEWNKGKSSSIGQFLKSGNLSKSDLSEEGTPFILYGELYTKYKEIANVIYSKTNTPCKVVSEKGDVIIPKSGETPEDISTTTCIPYDGVALR